jgi:hypothetical protein
MMTKTRLTGPDIIPSGKRGSPTPGYGVTSSARTAPAST